MRTHFNLATAPLENNRRFIAGSSILGVIGLAVMLLLSLHTVHARRANREMREGIDNLREQVRNSLRQQESLRNAFKSPQTQEALKRSEFLNGLIEARTFPWTKMFANLEQILPPGVRVISISPKMDKEGLVTVVFSVGAVNDEQAIKFLNSIDTSPVFSDVHVTREDRPQKESNNGTDTDKVLVDLEAHYSVS
jgi:Tfp pilus assembly protein PilN